MKKCDDCECSTVCARWVDGNASAVPGEPDVCGALVASALSAERDPYFTDRDYPVREDWADGRNDFARPFPDLPWYDRALPFDSCAALVGPMDVGGGCRKPVIHDFPTPDVSRSARQRRLVSVQRPERVA